MQAIVVTGASSGIGEAIARAAASAGAIVFAGVRSEADAARVAGHHANIRPLLLDVTDAASIERAAGALAGSGVPLRGLVNNAGIAVGGPLELLPLEELRRQFEVNLFGQLAVTQAFLPFLRTAKGRIVFVGSIGGRMAAPFIGAYAASKFALRAMSDAMRVELRLAGIDVALVEPGSVKTSIWQKGRQRRDEMMPQLSEHPASRHYEAAIARVVAITHERERFGISAEIVAAVVMRALTSRRPRARYLVGRDAQVRALVALLPPRVRDRLISRALRF